MVFRLASNIYMSEDHRLRFCKGPPQNYQNGSVSNQLTDVAGGGVVGCDSLREYKSIST
jgi:hypothetical protein